MLNLMVKTTDPYLLLEKSYTENTVSAENANSFNCKATVRKRSFGRPGFWCQMKDVDESPSFDTRPLV
jgi:hypothetical protein